MHDDITGADQRSQQTVYVIDDDEAVRDALGMLFRSVGYRVETYAAAADFLDGLDLERSGCLVLDVRLPGMSGLELHERLVSRHALLPVVFITGHGDVPMAVRAMKAGAVDFLEKPFNEQNLLDRVSRAFDLETRERREREQESDLRKRFESLTPREREVLDLVVDGELNKVIASRLGVSQRTVEIHRAHVMSKMGAESLAHLVRLTLRLRNGSAADSTF
jgi:FixJ family two-component response regulator